MSNDLLDTIGEALGLEEDNSQAFTAEDRLELETIIQQEYPFSLENIERIQTLLHEAGWGETVGDVDGIMGPNTADGIAQYVMHDSAIIRGERLGPNMDDVLARASNDVVQDFQNVAAQFQYPISSMMPSIARGNTPAPSPVSGEDFETISEGHSLYTDVFNTSMAGASFDIINEILADGDIAEPETIQRLQIHLNAAGINIGRADGILGELTSQGVLNYVAGSSEAMAGISQENLDTLLERATPEAQAQILTANPYFILNMEGEQMESMLDNMDPETLADFQSRLLQSPEFRETLSMFTDSGDLTNGSESLIAAQKLMTASGLYNRGIDGIMGGGTQAGLDRFNGLEPLASDVVPLQPIQALEL